MLLILGTVLAVVLEPTLPRELQAFLARESEAEPPVSDIFFLALGGTLLFAQFVSYVGLYFWKRWAKVLFLVSTVVLYLGTLFDPKPVVLAALPSWLFNLSELCCGMLIACLFFVESIRTKFHPTSRKNEV